MAGAVLRRNFFTIFEECASYQHLWQKSATTPSRKPLAASIEDTPNGTRKKNR